jgi:hypothetical protein
MIGDPTMWKIALAASLATGVVATAVSAQEALVTVDLSSLHGQIATNLDVEADEVPTTLRLPAATAADVCGGAASPGGSCTATDMMWATHYAIREVEGDPFSTEDRDDADRPDPDVLLDARAPRQTCPRSTGPKTPSRDR